MDRAALLESVGEIVAPGCIPGGLAVFGDDAFVVSTGQLGKARVPLLAGARHGKGRVVACGHEGFFGASLKHPDNARLLANMARWASGKTLAGLRVGALGQAPEMLDSLQAAGCRPVALKPEDLPARLAGLSLLWLNQGSLDGAGDEERIGAVREWVARGGGLVVAGPAWGWQQMNPSRDLTRDHTGNRLLLPMGIAFTPAMLSATGKSGFVTGEAAPDLMHASKALDALEAHAAGRAHLDAPALEQVTVTLGQAAGTLPEETGFQARVRAACARGGGGTLPSKQTPVTADMPFARLRLVLDLQRIRGLPPEKVTAHPSAASFPGEVPAEAPRVTRTLTLDTRRPAWLGTGLYAPPGEVITVTLPREAAGKGLGVRIGAHTDALWHLPRWERFPEVSLRRPLNAPECRVASAFGGTLFVDVPGKCGLGEVKVTFAGAVAQPRFVRGATTDAEWKVLRAAPAPWAELEGHGVILTVPSAVVRGLDDPEALMAYWDEVLEHCQALYAAPRRNRPERYCVDRQISAGYMHSGYPIMTHDDVAARFTDLRALRGKGGVWGLYHELGHNFQRPEWTWETMGEVTNNLFSLYGAEKLNGVTVGAHPAMTEEQIRKRVEAVAGRPGAEAYYKRDPWFPLTMFVLLRRSFGWEPFTRVFAEFRDLPEAERPKSDGEKRDQFLIRFSRAAGRNISGYLAAWGVQTSERARAAGADLPAFTVDEAMKSIGQ